MKYRALTKLKQDLCVPHTVSQIHPGAPDYTLRPAGKVLREAVSRIAGRGHVVYSHSWPEYYNGVLSPW